MLYKKIKIRGIDHFAAVTGYFIDNSPEMDEDKERPLILIVPGGAYWMTSDREAEPVALKCLARGYHAAVIRYSVFPARFPEALVQLAKTIAYFKKNAGAYHIKNGRIITVGFSAGGHLAASLGVFWKEQWFSDIILGKTPSDPVIKDYMELREKKGLDRQQAGEKKSDFSESGFEPAEIEISESELPFLIRPDRQVHCYPVITSGKNAHKDSFRNLTGLEEDEGGRIWEKLSLEQQVTSDVPPAFIWHTFGDNDVPVQNSLLFSEELFRAGVPVELHIYEKGRHGLSLGTRDVMAGENRKDATPEEKLPEPLVQTWFRLMMRWLKYT